MADWSEAGAGFVLADLAACFRDGTFDLVMFNPPYLPSDGVEDPAVDAGREAEIPLGFLREALRVVADSGTVVMLLGTDSPVARIQEECERRGFRLARVEEMHLFFEDLVIYEASRAGRTVGRSWR
jgi:release factor glutamine methyltransferase